MPGTLTRSLGCPCISWLVSISSSDSALIFFPGQIPTTFPLQATTTCSCEEAPPGCGRSSSWVAGALSPLRSPFSELQSFQQRFSPLGAVLPCVREL